MLKAATKYIKEYWVWGLALLFVAMNLTLTYFEVYYFNLVPLVLLVVLLAFTRLDILLYAVVLLTPLSVPLRQLSRGLDFDFFIPTEPILFGVLLLFVFKFLLGHRMDKKVLYHPVSLGIYIYLFWILVTSVTSTMPVVSFKFLLAKLWFIIPFYFIVSQLFKDPGKVKVFVWCYVLALVVVVFYTISNHLSYGLNDKQASHFVMQPFYNDHTAYGALLAMFLPFVIAFALMKKNNLAYRVFLWLLVGLIATALLLSYSRAAWISFVAVVVLYGVIRFRVRFEYLVAFTVIVLAMFYANREDIMLKLEKNRQDSSAKLSEHVQSISNISTDASNVERINRWKCAIKMFEEKPIFGWGPGTYQFQYAPFQEARDLTIISTNFGNRGNAHSEYIGPMAEQGIFGPVAFLIIVVISILTGLRVYFNARDREIRLIALAAMLGLVTYYIHGTLNNFLDTDKASVPFWGFLAILVALDIYHRDSGDT